MNNIKDIVREFLLRDGASIAGFGAVPESLPLFEVNRAYPRTITFGYRLSKTVLATIADRPTLIYKHHYKTINWLLDQTACRLVTMVEDQGFGAVAIPASQLIDWKNHRGHASHRHLGVAAGLGYIGRSGLLIHQQYGAQVRYASVLTDLPFEPDPAVSGSCGDCVKCLAACPARAISDAGVDIKTCFGKLDEFVRIKGVGQHICGVCVKVCDGQN